MNENTRRRLQAATWRNCYEKLVAAGAEVVQDVTEIPDMVTFAQFRDPAGNIVGLVKAG